MLASQWGYFPGFCWIVIGSCLAGGVHDFVVLLASVRQDGLSLPKIARNLIGPMAGVTTTLATLFIIIATLAGVGMVVVKALGESPWGMFTIIVTIPAALLTGFWMYKIRPGRIGEASLIGVTLVLLGVIFGKPFADSAYRGYLRASTKQLVGDPAHVCGDCVDPAGVGAAVPAGLSQLLHEDRRDLSAGRRHLRGPSDVEHARHDPLRSRRRPGRPGTVWPFVCIVIMCGALSGFHALIASGTTPKMVNKESDIRPIGYGGDVVGGLRLDHGPGGRLRAGAGRLFQDQHRPGQIRAAAWEQRKMPTDHWDLSPRRNSTSFRRRRGEEEKLAGRTAGAVTLAVGMAKIFSSLPGMQHLIAYWYHFIVMFEALFILTLLETGTRVARFIFQESLTQFCPRMPRQPARPNWTLNVA